MGSSANASARPLQHEPLPASRPLRTGAHPFPWTSQRKSLSIHIRLSHARFRVRNAKEPDSSPTSCAPSWRPPATRPPSGFSLQSHQRKQLDPNTAFCFQTSLPHYNIIVFWSDSTPSPSCCEQPPVDKSASAPTFAANPNPRHSQLQSDRDSRDHKRPNREAGGVQNGERLLILVVCRAA